LTSPQTTPRYPPSLHDALPIYSSKAGEVTYTVEAGDCWSVIAQDHNMTNSDLLKLNPGYDINKLQIGDVLVISNAVPYLTVVARSEEHTSELQSRFDLVCCLLL